MDKTFFGTTMRISIINCYLSLKNRWNYLYSCICNVLSFLTCSTSNELFYPVYMLAETILYLHVIVLSLSVLLTIHAEN